MDRSKHSAVEEAVIATLDTSPVMLMVGAYRHRLTKSGRDGNDT